MENTDFEKEVKFNTTVIKIHFTKFRLVVVALPLSCRAKLEKFYALPTC